MSTHKYIDRICCGAMALAVLLAVIFMNGESLGIQAAASSMGYEDRLFDTSAVHTLLLYTPAAADAGLGVNIGCRAYR